MTIYDIKRQTRETSPYFFSAETLRFFGQTMDSFDVSKCADGRYFIQAPIIDSRGVTMGNTERYFNPANNELERE